MSLRLDQEVGGLEVFRVLAAGGCVVEVPRGGAVGPRGVAGQLREHGVTVWWAEAGMVERVGREFPWGLKSVRRIMCEEEVESLEELLEVLPEGVVERVYGVYGGVETGGVGMVYGLGGLRAGGAKRRMEMEEVAAGKRIYLVDSELREVPEGVVGEICVGERSRRGGMGWRRGRRSSGCRMEGVRREEGGCTGAGTMGGREGTGVWSEWGGGTGGER